MDILINDVVGVIIQHLANVDYAIPMVAFALTNRQMYKLTRGDDMLQKLPQVEVITRNCWVSLTDRFVDLFYSRIISDNISIKYYHACDSYISKSNGRLMDHRQGHLALKAAKSSDVAFMKICDFLNLEIKIWPENFKILCQRLEAHCMSKSKFKHYIRKIFQFTIYSEPVVTILGIIECTKRFRHQLKSLYSEISEINNKTIYPWWY
jgi:hypothetical protein